MAWVVVPRHDAFEELVQAAEQVEQQRLVGLAERQVPVVASGADTTR
jgi:hypothetical protein